MEEKKKQTEPEACKVAKKCGGCQYQGVPYKEQLKKEAENGERSVVKIRKSRTDHRNGESVLLQK